MTVVGTLSTRAAQSSRHRRDTRLAGSGGGRVRARRTDELVHWSAGRPLRSAGFVRAGAESAAVACSSDTSGLPCLSHLSKDRRAEKVTPISVTPQAKRG